jgi:hypothetical protein
MQVNYLKLLHFVGSKGSLTYFLTYLSRRFQFFTSLRKRRSIGVIGVFGFLIKRNKRVTDPYALTCDPYDPCALFLSDVSQCR